MKRLDVFRAARYAALLLLAACADAPTGIATAADTAPAMNVYPAPVVTVTSSGGHPLISWSALAGATSYDVAIVVTTLETHRPSGTFTLDTEEFTIESTTGTSYLDSSNYYLGGSTCVHRQYPIVTHESWEYKVTATFAGGTSSALVAAPISNC